jgi:hypothetical protein
VKLNPCTVRGATRPENASIIIKIQGTPATIAEISKKYQIEKSFNKNAPFVSLIIHVTKQDYEKILVEKKDRQCKFYVQPLSHIVSSAGGVGASRATMKFDKSVKFEKIQIISNKLAEIGITSTIIGSCLRVVWLGQTMDKSTLTKLKDLVPEVDKIIPDVNSDKLFNGQIITGATIKQSDEQIENKKKQQQKLLEQQQAEKAKKLAEKQQEVDPLRQKISAAYHLTPAQWDELIKKHVPTATVEHNNISTTTKIILFKSPEENNKYGEGEGKIQEVFINGDNPLFCFHGVGSVIVKKKEQM